MQQLHSVFFHFAKDPIVEDVERKLKFLHNV